MSIKEKDIKLLWGRAASRCSFSDCRIRLAQDKKTIPESFPIGEQAHIVGKEEGSARSISSLTQEERDAYHNLILLCPTHHTLIDKNPEDYPVEKLHMIKSDHEYWVETSLSEKTDRSQEAEAVFYANIVDITVEKCHFARLEGLLSNLTGPAHTLPFEDYKDGIDFSIAIYKAVWPRKLVDLESALRYFGSLMNLLLNFYMGNAEEMRQDETMLKGLRFYKSGEWNPEEHRKRVDLFVEWEKLLDEIVIEAVKCANLVCDLVRKHLNPLFFITQGRFAIVGLGEELQVMHSIFVFTEEEMNEILPSLDKRLEEWHERVSTFKKKCPYV